MMCLVQICTINMNSLVKVKLVCVFILISDVTKATHCNLQIHFKCMILWRIVSGLVGWVTIIRGVIFIMNYIKVTICGFSDF